MADPNRYIFNQGGFPPTTIFNNEETSNVPVGTTSNTTSFGGSYTQPNRLTQGGFTSVGFFSNQGQVAPQIPPSYPQPPNPWSQVPPSQPQSPWSQVPPSQPQSPWSQAPPSQPQSPWSQVPLSSQQLIFQAYGSLFPQSSSTTSIPRVQSPNLSPVLPVVATSNAVPPLDSNSVGRVTFRPLEKIPFSISNYSDETLYRFYTGHLPPSWKNPEIGETREHIPRIRAYFEYLFSIEILSYIKADMNLNIYQRFKQMGEYKDFPFVYLTFVSSINDAILNAYSTTSNDRDIDLAINSGRSATIFKMLRGNFSYEWNSSVSAEDRQIFETEWLESPSTELITGVLRTRGYDITPEFLTRARRSRYLSFNYAYNILETFYNRNPVNVREINQYIESKILGFPKPTNLAEALQYAERIGIRVPLHIATDKRRVKNYIMRNIRKYGEITPGSNDTKKMTDFQILERLRAVFTYESREDLINKARAFSRLPNYEVPFLPKSQYYASKATNQGGVVISTFEEVSEVIQDGTAIAWGNLNSSYISSFEELNALWSRVTADFPHPRDYNSGLTATTNLPDNIVREVKFLLLDIPETSRTPDVTSLVEIIDRVLRNKIQLLANEEQRIATYNAFSQENKDKIRDYFMAVFYAGMRMRQWKGPGHPYPYTGSQTSQIARELHEVKPVPEDWILGVINGLRIDQPQLTQMDLESVAQRLRKMKSSEYPSMPNFTTEDFNQIERRLWREHPDAIGLQIKPVMKRLLGQRPDLSSEDVSAYIEGLASEYMAQMNALKESMSPEIATFVEEMPCMNIREGNQAQPYERNDVLRNFKDLLNIVRLGTGTGIPRSEREEILRDLGRRDVPIDSCQRMSSSKFIATAARFMVVYRKEPIPNFEPHRIEVVY